LIDSFAFSTSFEEMFHILRSQCGWLLASIPPQIY
jgi:hypothetical protein